MADSKRRVMLLHTGGTFGMKVSENSEKIVPSAAYLEDLFVKIPELKKIANLTMQVVCSIDSSDINIKLWKQLCTSIVNNWHLADGFVIIHGTDTMAFSATALSFFLSGITKPIVFTGSQRPLSVFRSDARANIIDAVELATLGIPEIMICFDSFVHRGTRVTKQSSEHMQAFRSYNEPPLGNFGVHFIINHDKIKKNVAELCRHAPVVDCRLETNIISLDAVPGINLNKELISSLVANTKGIIIRGFGSGTLPLTQKSWLSLCEQAYKNKIPVVMGSQCGAGTITLEAYQNGRAFIDCGVISGADMSFESQAIKLMVMLGRKIPFERWHEFFATPMALECEINNSAGTPLFDNF